MPVHPQYAQKRRRGRTVGAVALGIGVLGTLLPVIPGALFLLLGLSVLSVWSRTAHRWLATLRARYATLDEPLARAETYFTDLFDLTTHNRTYCTIPTQQGTPLSALVEVSEIGTGVAVLLHAASGVKEAPVMETLAETMRAEGYTVVRFDARHAVGDGNEPFTQFTTSAYQEDLAEVIAWVRVQTWGHGPLTLVGHSVGGLVAGLYAAAHPEAVHKLVLFAPTLSGASYVHSYDARDAAGLEAWRHTGLRTVPHPLTGETYGLSYLFVEDLMQYDLTAHARELTMPVLIFVGTEDQTTSPSECDAFAHTVGTHARYVRVPNVPHAPSTHRELLTVLRTMMRF